MIKAIKTRAYALAERFQALSKRIDEITEIPLISRILRFAKSPLFIAVWAAYLYVVSLLDVGVYWCYLPLMFLLFLLVFSRDVVPIAAIMFLAYYGLRIDQGESYLNSLGYYSSPAIVAQAFAIVIVVYIFSLFFLLRLQIFSKKPTLLSISVIVFCITFFFNGLFYQPYSGINILFGGILGISMMLFYALFSTLKFSEESLTRIAYIFLALGALISVQVLTKTATSYVNGKLFVEGFELDRFAIAPHYTHPNYSAGSIIFSLPLTLYLAAKKKHGWIYCIAATAYLGISLLLLSRNSALVGFIFYPAALIAVCLKGNSRKSCLIVTAAVGAVVLVGGIVMWEKLYEMFSRFFREGIIIDPETGGFSDNNRFYIYSQGMELFKKAPIFGGGFAPKIDFADNSSIISNMYHSLPVQLLASMGLVGTAAFALHAFAVLRCIVKTFNIKIYFAMISAGAILALSMVDNHFFYPYILPYYCAAIAEINRIYKHKLSSKQNEEVTIEGEENQPSPTL